MPIQPNASGPFTESAINQVLNLSGVYALYRGNELTYYGKSVTVRDRLQEHRRGEDGYCTKTSTRFAVEYTTAPTARERSLLQEFKRAYGRLPRCNNVMP